MNLYKYRGGSEDVFQRDLKSLTENYYWSAEIHSLNDPCEALINSSRYFSALDDFEKAIHITIGKHIDVNIIRNHVNSLLEKAKTVGIYSLSKIYDDELMWSHYAAAHHGFCIGFNMHYLQRGLTKYFYDLLDVSYHADPPQLNLEEHFVSKGQAITINKLIGTKSLKWRNEEEVRIISYKPGAHKYDYRSVASIYFGLRMRNEHIEQIMSALRGRNIKYYKMKMLKEAYKFVAEPINDQYSAAEKYLYKIAPICEGAIDEMHIQAHFQKYTPYLQKAAEVAKREPYCLEVISLGFSFNCPPDQPIIYAHCKRSDVDYGNFEYSLLEIDKVFAEITDL